MDYQDRLIQAKRTALWRECDRVRAERARQGKRAEQVAFSATVVFAIFALVLLAGVGMGAWVAVIGGGK